MPSRVQTLRSSTAGSRPAGGTREAGELYANYADRQIGIIDVAKAPMDLLAVRVFSTTASYVAGDLVVQAGQLYRAKGSVSPGVFTPASWDGYPNLGNDGVGSGLDADLLDGQQGAYFLARANHTGTLPAAAFDDTAHGNRGGGTLHLTATAASAGFMIDAPSDGLPYSRLNAAWVPGAYSEAPSDGSLYGRLNSAWSKAVKLVGDIMTGNLEIKPAGGAAQLFLTKIASGQKASVVGRSNSLSRWELHLGDATAESAGAGSDFSLQRFNDAGTLIDTVLKGTRVDGLLTIKGDPTVALGVVTKQYADSLAKVIPQGWVTSSQTWTKPAGVTHIWLEYVAGGGAGGGVSATGTTAGAGGGGGGGSWFATMVDVRAVASIAIVIGAGGTAVGGGIGGNGGDTTITIGGTTLTAGGGKGGNGGTGSNVTFSYNGGLGGTAGGSGGNAGHNGITAIGLNAQSGIGASTPWGTGGYTVRQATGTWSHGNAGAGYGAGGAGGAGYNIAAPAIAGGAGAPGAARITGYSFPASA